MICFVLLLLILQVAMIDENVGMEFCNGIIFEYHLLRTKREKILLQILACSEKVSKN